MELIRKTGNGASVMADRVSGHGLKYQVHVGFGEDERRAPQIVTIDFDARTHWREPARQDCAEGIVDYAKVDKGIQALVVSRQWQLIESIAESVARFICRDFPVDQVRVTVSKNPADMPHCDAVSVSCSRTPADYLD
jgi:dihydroneopterin aldolase